MKLSNQVIAVLLGSTFAATSNAEELPQTTTRADQNQIYRCAESAIKAIPVPDGTFYYDSEDHGIKKYSEGPNHLMGVTAYINPNEGDAGITPPRDTLHIMAKFFTEKDEKIIDASGGVRLTFNSLGILAPESIAFTTSSSEEPQSENMDMTIYNNFMSDTLSTFTLAFTVCMNFEPFEPAGGTPINLPHFPDPASL